jgi:trimeric autotransporter adhesin
MLRGMRTSRTLPISAALLWGLLALGCGGESAQDVAGTDDAGSPAVGQPVGASGGGAVGSGGAAVGSGGGVVAQGSGGVAAGGASGDTSGGSGGTAGQGGSPGAAGAATGAGCRKVVYDGESVKLSDGVTWSDPTGGNGSSSVTESTDNPHSGSASMKVTLTWNKGYYGGAFGYNFAGYASTGAIDVRNADSLEFWVRTETGTNDHFVVWIGDATGTAAVRDKAGGYVPLVTTTWQRFAIPLSALPGVDLARIWEIDGDTHSKPFGSAGGATFYIDDVAFTSSTCP